MTRPAFCFKSVAEVEEQTRKLPVTMRVAGYTPQQIAQENAYYAGRRGFLPFIADFSKIVHFGNTHPGAPYCLDYRENADEPNVIQWHLNYWRRFAPNF